MQLQTTDQPLDDIPLGIGVFSVMGTNGDTKHIWDKTKPQEVAAARALFQTLVTEQHYLAFKATGKSGDKGEQVREFDPEDERLIFTPRLVGG